MDYSEAISLHLKESAIVKEKTIHACLPQIQKVIDITAQALQNGHKILICGNGGSAADSQHIAAEFVIRLSHTLRRPAIPALALTTDSSVLTAGANDIGFENVFARQIEAFGQPGDILIGITTSGNSANILKAIETAKSKKMITIGLLGNQGGQCRNLVDLPVIVPSDNTQYIQETHITIGHIIVELVEKTLFAQ